MTTINFGVTDLPYSQQNIGKVKKGKTKGAARVSTTGEVAELLENKYKIMEHFWKLKQDDIVNGKMGDALVGAFEDVMMGGPPSKNVYASAMSEVEKMFMDFLSTREVEGLGIPGVPTKAALMGISHRLKNKKGARRPSFIDTGLYQHSFRGWVTE